MEILYCDTCGTRVPDEDFKAGTAVRNAGGRTLCAKCVQAQPVSKTQAAPPSRKTSSSNVLNRNAASTAHLSATPAQRPAATAPRISTGQHAAPMAREASGRGAESAATPPGTQVWLFGGIGAGIVGIIMIVLALRGRTPPPEKPDVKPPSAITDKKQDAGKTLVSVKDDGKKAQPDAIVVPVKPVADTPPDKPANPPKRDESIEDYREGYAARKWADVKKAVQKPGVSPGSAYRQVKEFVSNYSSTAAGREAAAMLKDLAKDLPPSPTAETTIANYRRDYKRDSPAPGWRYLCNSKGQIGTAANYTELVWNSDHTSYCADAKQYPAGNRQGWAALRPDGIHPGTGIDQGVPFEHFAIAAYSVPAGKEGKIGISGMLHRNDGGGTVELRIFANDQQKEQCIVKGPPYEFTIALGTLNAGDTIYVCVGPDRSDGNDTCGFDFTIYQIK
ncbi:MAG TPA: hypothetical protein VGP72_17300 [Planctomycetota bacterium]|jgi:hypothetical protein